MGRKTDDDVEVTAGGAEPTTKDKKKGKAAKVVPAVVADAAARVGTALVASFLMAMPALRDAVGGRRDLLGAVVWWASCYIVSRLAIAAVWSLYESYRAGRDAAEDAAEPPSPPEPLALGALLNLSAARGDHPGPSVTSQ